jgi:peptide/nickel transport system ATP-binding protein/glutathione transport system ATP-binding protein
MLDSPVARIEDLRVEFRTRDGMVAGVADLSLAVHPGETVCLVGESGSGKSVSALSMMRLVEYDGGAITGGRVVFDRRAGGETDLARTSQPVMRKIRGNDIGMIFQEPMTALNPVFTIGRQLTEGLRLHAGLGRRAARARAREMLREVRIPDPERRLAQYPHELSGGMRQRVVIAMALACAPRLLIADEPTTALDVTTQAGILALIDRLKRETGTAVILITHDMAVVAQMADRVVVMHRGHKVEDGPVGRVFAAPRAACTRAMLDAVPRLGAARGPPGGAAPRDPGTTRPLLNVRGLVTRFPVRGGLLRRRTANVHAVEDVSFAVGRGRTLALVGESGCGKSTAGRSLLRLVEPLRGAVTLDGTDIMALDRQGLRRARRGMQMVFQDPFASLDPQMTLAEQVAEPMKNYDIGTPADRGDRVAALFDRVHLPRDLLRRFPHALSGGQRQRAAIARALALSPALLVADEAVSALDVTVQARVLELMMELQAELGLSLLFISHDIAVVDRISHDIAVMHRGRIVERGPRAAVVETPRHPYTKALLRAVPVADPARRPVGAAAASEPAPAPIHPAGHEPGPSVYEQVGEDHVVLVRGTGD